MPTPSSSLRQRFLRAEIDGAETAAALREALLAEEPAEPWSPPPVEVASYAGALQRARTAAAALGRARARGTPESGPLAGAASAPVADLRTTILADPALHTFAAAETLRDASLAACTTDPHRAVALAELAVETVERAAAPAADPPHLVADLRALALAQLGNARRVASDLRAADRAFAAAFEEADRGTGDPLVRARLESLAASLRSDQSRFDEAVALARRSARRYRRLGDDHAYGRVRLKQATFHAYRGELDTACSVLAEALEHVDADAEPRLAFAARHNRASYLDRLGRSGEAAAELAAAEPLCVTRLDTVRFTWLRGRIALSRGDTETGERLLWQAREEFVAFGIGYDAALVTLEIAVLYTEQRRTPELRRLAEEMVPLFAARDLHDEARAALRLYCEAVRAESDDLELLQGLLAYLESARRRPNLRFEP